MEKSEKNEKKAYNTTLLFDRKGELKAKYRKIHLFDVEVPNVVKYHESSLIEAGNQAVVVDTEFGKVGFAICYGKIKIKNILQTIPRRIEFTFSSFQHHFLL